MGLTFKVIFHEKGFTPGKDVSENEMEGLRALFMQMYDLWARLVNQMQDQINETWEKYEAIRKSGNGTATLLCRMTMEIDEKTDYYDWCERWYKDVADSVDLSYMQTRLRSMIFRDGENPMYGVTFKDHPEWTMDFTVEPIE